MTNYPGGPGYPQGPAPYGSYGAPVPPPAPVRPQVVTNAVWLMYAGAAVSVLNAVVGALTAHSLVTRIYAQFENQLPPGQPRPQIPLDLLTRVFAVALVVGGIVNVLLWLWMAWKNRRGRSWARVLSTVFFGFLCVSVISSITRFSSTGLGFVILTAVVWVIGLAAIIMLWRPEASRYYEAVKAQDAFGQGQPWPAGGYGGYGAGYGGYGSPQSVHGYAPPAPPVAPPGQPGHLAEPGQPPAAPPKDPS